MLWYLVSLILHFFLKFLQTPATKTETVQILKYDEKCGPIICHIKVYEMKLTFDKIIKQIAGQISYVKCCR